MNPFSYTAQVLREFTKRWGSYLLLVAVVTGITDLVFLPLLRWSAGTILSLGHVPYLSYDNILSVAVKQPLVLLALGFVLIVLLLFVYLQFAWLLGGVENIRSRQDRGVTAIAIEGLRDLRHLRISGFLFFTAYALLVVPFADEVVGSSLLTKVRIPTFIEDWFQTKPLIATAVAIFYLVMTYLGIRWIRVLPTTILQDVPVHIAARKSWTETRGKFWAYTWKALVLSATFTVITFAWAWLWIGIQTLADRSDYAGISAVITMTLFLLGKMFLWGLASTGYLLFLCAPINVRAQQSFTADSRPRHHWLRRVAVAVCGLFGLLIITAFGGAYMFGALDSDPLTISHRGVDDGNGVQNTIPALIKTSKEKPDYVEMDLHETKDGQFICMHDENLADLTGVDKTPRELTLAQLTRLTARENGHKAKLASFDDYLAAAEAHHQKLLVELKPTAADSGDMAQRFAKRYGARLHHDGSWVHSLSYKTLLSVHKTAPSLRRSFIIPYSLIAPQSNMNAYTVEESTLDDDLIESAHDHHQQVLAWTVNSEADTNRMLFYQVDGIITDNLHALQTTIRRNNNHPSYATRLRLFTTTLDDFGGSATEN